MEDGNELRAGVELPTPRIIIPRLEVSEEQPADAEAPISADELASLEAEVAAQGLAVRALKDAGAPKEQLNEQVGVLLGLKARLPDGHELKGGKKKKKKGKRASSAT
uniref:WHEP-TRS domain-containing protein n=1 Tax=Coccolithus braarudii TaxID=221442 RepID=A0A7S0L9A2_9EUKA